MLCGAPRHMNWQPVPTEKRPQLTGIVLKDALVLAQRRIKDRRRLPNSDSGQLRAVTYAAWPTALRRA